MKEMIAEEKQFNQKLRTNRYLNGQLAVFFQDYRGEPIAELSLMSELVQLAPDEFILKDYSENQDLAKKLIEFQLINTTDRFVLIGSHLCPICYLTSEL